uniref:DNA-directed DNA polymerase n=1 Tax=viral metagenome TaxID=1070528 RepID=A0A6M3JX02_9ZZZZ
MKDHNFAQRRLDPLKGRRIPKVMLFTDTETQDVAENNTLVQKFRLGWIFTWDSHNEATRKNVTETYFDNAVMYCKYIEDQVHRDKRIHIFGHNIFFDLQCAGFFEYFTQGGWELEWIYDRGLTYILRIIKGKEKIMIVSTTNYFDCSLKELGEMIGLEKQSVEFRNVTEKRLREYCYRDTEIVIQAVWYYIQFITDNDLGSMALTKSSQAFKSYRTRFMNNPIFLHNEDRSFDLERKAYMGGRTEAFHIGKVPGEDFLILDVNSMYPYVMQKYRYPCKMVCIMQDEKLSNYTRWLGSYGMIAEVDLITPEPAFGARYKNKLIFPTGEFRAYLCSEGLKYALKRGYVKKIIRASLYLMEDLFSDYVTFFGELRDKYQSEDNPVMSKLCKYMHNSLYGKWGERELLSDMVDDHSGEPYIHREIWDAVHGGWWIETHLMNKIIMRHPGGESPHSFPAIAAHITENARLELWSLIKTAGVDTVLYCDTDSIIIRASDLNNVSHLLNEKKAGGLKVQGRYQGLQIDGAKNYRTDDKRHIKGIPESAVEIHPKVFQYESFERQTACMKKGRIAGVEIVPVTRRLTHTYDKGLITASGRVKPYHFTFFEQPVLQPPQL